MFVVVLVVTLLTAIGVFALRSVSLVDVAAGYDRQASQTLYLSEYAGRAASAELGDGAAKIYIDKVSSGADTNCLVNTKLNATALDPSITFLPCYKLFLSEIDSRVDTHFSGHKVLTVQDGTKAGSLGPMLDTGNIIPVMEGVFVVEMTDAAATTPNPGSPQGGNNPANQFSDVQLTLTAFAQVRPTEPDPADPWCTGVNAAAAAASVSSLRAHVTLRNVPK